MEVSEALRANFAAMDIRGLQRSVGEPLILSGRRKDAWLTPGNLTNLNFLIIIITSNIGWMKGIDMPGGLEIDVGDVPVIHLIKDL